MAWLLHSIKLPEWSTIHPDLLIQPIITPIGLWEQSKPGDLVHGGWTSKFGSWDYF